MDFTISLKLGNPLFYSRNKFKNYDYCKFPPRRNFSVFIFDAFLEDWGLSGGHQTTKVSNIKQHELQKGAT